MLVRAFVLLVLVLLVASASTAAALDLEPGVIIQQGATTYTVNHTLLPDTLTFEAGTGAPVFNGSLTLDLEPFDGSSPYAWLLENVTTSNVTVTGNTSVNGTYRLAGLNVTTYAAAGVIFTAPFTFGGPGVNFTVPAGAQTIVVMPTAPIPNGSRLVLSSTYSPDSQSIGSTVSIIDGNGNAISDIPVLLTVIDPNGVVLGSAVMTETVVPGVYRATTQLSNSSALGNYVTVANVGHFIDSQSVRVDAPIGTVGNEMLDVHTALDPWIPIVLWAIVTIIFLYYLAWAPATGGMIALGDNLLPHGQVIGLAGDVMIFVVLLALHVLITRGLIPKPFSR